jgi:hypothetical protein
VRTDEKEVDLRPKYHAGLPRLVLDGLGATDEERGRTVLTDPKLMSAVSLNPAGCSVEAVFEAGTLASGMKVVIWASPEWDEAAMTIKEVGGIYGTMKLERIE